MHEFVFGGEQPFPPDSTNMIWIWRQPNDGPIVYGTQQNARQDPAVLLNGEAKIVYAFAQIEYFTPTSWPATYWDVPDVCRGAGTWK